MKPFIKTLIGDGRNVGVVALVLLAGAACALGGQPRLAWVVTPLLALGGVAWLSRNG